MRFAHLVVSSPARLAFAVAVVFAARVALRQPPPLVGEPSTPQTTSPTTAQTPIRNNLVAPRSRAGDPMHVIWADMYQLYGNRLAQAALSSNIADYLALWQDMGSFLRSRGVSTTKFQQWMTDLGWPAEEQQRHLNAAGYVWPPQDQDDAPEQYFRRDP